MSHLTDLRFQKLKPTFDAYLELLRVQGEFHPGSLEAAIKEVLGVDWTDFHEFMVDLAKKRKYRLVALYFMRHIHGDMVRNGNKLALAKAYGTPFDSDERPAVESAFWARELSALRQHSSMNQSDGTAEEDA